MKKLQCRALCLVFNDFKSSYVAPLKKVNTYAYLTFSRIRLMAIETFKILHKLTPVNLQYQVSYKNSVYSFRYENLVEVSRVGTTKFGKSTLHYKAAGVWNSLPNEIAYGRRLM